MKLWELRGVVSSAVGVLLSMSAAAQGLMESDRPAFVTDPSFEPTMLPVIPYPDEMYALPGVEPYSCYRVRRCSAHDLYYFADRPNRLIRLAPDVPAARAASQAPVPYLWFFVPVTPEENILPKYRTASQVRDEHRAVGRPIDDAN
jgi:hypothetical protein